MLGLSRPEKWSAAGYRASQRGQGVAGAGPQAGQGGAGLVEMGLDPVFEKRKVRGISTFKETAAKVYAANQKMAERQARMAVEADR